MQLYLHENEPLDPTEERRSLVFFAHSDVVRETTEYPSAEDIAALAEGRDPSWKAATRKERERATANDFVVAKRDAITTTPAAAATATTTTMEEDEAAAAALYGLR